MLVKWVLKIKQEQDGNSRYKARIVVHRFSQILGIEFMESFLPVATKMSIQVLIETALYYK